MRCDFCGKHNEVSKCERIELPKESYIKLRCNDCRNWFESRSDKEDKEKEILFLDLDDDGELWDSVWSFHEYESHGAPLKTVVTPSVISQSKPPLHLFLQLRDFMALVSLAFWEGGQRPGRQIMGWVKTGETKEKILGGMMRHLTALESGERRDPNTNEDHLANFACNAIMYVVLTIRGLWK